MVKIEYRAVRRIRRPVHRVGRDLDPALPDAWIPRDLPPSARPVDPRPVSDAAPAPRPKGEYRVDPER
jgi:hypothetical protein